MDTQTLHERILYPVTRVRAANAGGSGVVVASLPDSQREGAYINLVLTCEHVIDKAIQVKEEWDPVLKRDRKRDYFEEVTVEIFDYDGSKVVSSNATQAQVIAYDKQHDLAVLRLNNHRQMPYVAELYPQDAIEDLRIGDEVWVSGCSLLHDPFPGSGVLTYLREIIEQKAYIMASAPSVFGNSGGGLFHGKNAQLLGLTSRITAMQLGFSVDIMTWMGFSTHPDRIYEFLREWELQCVFDADDDFHAGTERREARQKKAIRELLLGNHDEA